MLEIVKIKRGSKIPVKVEKIFTAEDMQKAATKKHFKIDQYFCHLDEYILCFPDQKVVEYIPLAREVFTVEKYKELLSKPYSNVDLYLWNISNIFVDNSNENKVVVSNKSDNLNTGLQLSVVHNSLSTGIGSTLMSSLEDSSWFEEGLSSISGAYDIMIVLHSIFLPQVIAAQVILLRKEY